LSPRASKLGTSPAEAPPRESPASGTGISLARLGPACAALGLVGLADPRVLLAVPLLAVLAHFLPQNRASRAGELGIYAVIGGVLVLAARYGGEPRGGVTTTVALVATIFVLARVFFQPNLAAKGGDLALVLVAATAIGAPPQRFVPFGPVATSLVALATASRWLLLGDLAPRAIFAAPKKRLAGLLFLVLAVGIGIAAGRALPRFTYRYAEKLAMLPWQRPRSGFDDDISLADGAGDVRKILESETVVLRVSGASVDHLRGKVYEVFDGHRWHGLSAIDPPRPLRTTASNELTTVEALQPSKVYFAPLDLAVRDAPTRDGSIARGGKRGTWELLPAVPALPPPTPRDRAPARTYPDEIRALALEWTAGQPTDNDRLLAIEGHLLAGYRYSLTREPFQGSAIYDFLFVHRAGHCELFATAFALLARSVGIPARLVGGYRVVEPGPRGDTYIVRERHAHAWVEAYHGDAWHTWDPTPAVAFTRKAPLWERALDAISDPKTEAAMGVVAGLVALGLFARTLVKRRKAKTTEAQRTAGLHPELVRLESVLAKDGVERARSEGLYAFAKRLEKGGDLLGAKAVRACANLSYGREGTEQDLVAQVNARVQDRAARASLR
jgi:hypothetical protein